MRFVDEFRDPVIAHGLAQRIHRLAGSNRLYRLMEFCGGHTHVIARHALAAKLPDCIRLIHGPGCPVCVLPIGRIDQAVRLALDHRVLLCTYGDALRVPASDRMSLAKARAAGADVRMVYSPLDAVLLAHQQPDRNIVLLAIGFETTAAPTAAAVVQAQRLRLNNFSLLCNLMLTPAAMKGVLDSDDEVKVDGFIGPAHVSTIIGASAYQELVENYRKPIVIAGFEPLDVLQAIERLIQQINSGRATLENAFTRAVLIHGNQKAIALMNTVFEVRDSFEWRGLGTMPHSAFRLTRSFARFDAEQRFGVPSLKVADHKACECAAILRGVKTPDQCRIFGTGCTPANPIGACMVSSEGACAAHYSYGQHRTAVRHHSHEFTDA